MDRSRSEARQDFLATRHTRDAGCGSRHIGNAGHATRDAIINSARYGRRMEGRLAACRIELIVRLEKSLVLDDTHPDFMASHEVEMTFRKVVFDWRCGHGTEFSADLPKPLLRQSS